MGWPSRHVVIKALELCLVEHSVYFFFLLAYSWVVPRPWQSFLLHPLILWTRPFTFPAWRKQTTFHLQVWQPIHIWPAWRRPQIRVFISHGLGEKVSKWETCVTVTGVYTQAEASLWHQDIRIDLLQFSSFADPASIWTTSRESLDGGRAHPPSNKAPKPNICSLWPRLGWSMLVMQKTGTANILCHWFQQWPCAVSVVSGTGGSVQCLAWRQWFPRRLFPWCGLGCGFNCLYILWVWFPMSVAFCNSWGA